MRLPNQITTRWQKWMADGTLALSYALLAEFLFLGCIIFAGLFTIETILPGFVTDRFSLAKFFALLLVLSFLLAFLGRVLSFSFPWNVTKRNPLLWIGLVWAGGILLISLYRFPLWAIPLLSIGFGIAGFSFWKIFSSEESTE